MKILPHLQNCGASTKIQKKWKNNFGNIFNFFLKISKYCFIDAYLILFQLAKKYEGKKVWIFWEHFQNIFLKIGENWWFSKNRCINVLFSTCKKYMKEKYYGYENFTTHTELRCEYKMPKNWENNYGNIFKIFFENWRLSAPYA